jgi:hypothetical protein
MKNQDMRDRLICGRPSLTLGVSRGCSPGKLSTSGRRRILLAFVLAAACLAAGPWSRAMGEEISQPVPAARPASAPTIVVNSPKTTGPITGPVRIEVIFVPAGNVPIDASSFKVSYGMFGIDITDRVKRYATVTDRGITADLPSMPKGRHTFEIQISDAQKRSAHIQVRCEVAR